MVRIFSHSEQKIKYNERKFANGLQSAITCCSRRAKDVIWDLYQHCNLLLSYRVGSLICFHLHSDGGVVDVGAGLVQGVIKPSQFDGLANGAKCCLYATGFDLASSSSCTLPDPSSKKL